MSPSVEEVIEFFTKQYNNGLGYDSINTARGALSSLGINFEGFPAGSHPLVIRFMRGIFALRPTKTRYTRILDVHKVLNYLRSLSPVKYVTLKDLTLKLTMLMALTNAARIQTLHVISGVKFKKFSSEFIFELNNSLKQNRPSCNVSYISFKAYPPDRRLCIYTVLKEYMARTKGIRKDENSGNLLVSYIKPYKPVTRDTIARWIKIVMTRSGINTNIFGSHSVRSAAVSKAKANLVPISVIMDKAGWTNEKTFAKYYDKRITDGDDVFQRGVLLASARK